MPMWVNRVITSYILREKSIILNQISLPYKKPHPRCNEYSVLIYSKGKSFVYVGVYVPNDVA